MPVQYTQDQQSQIDKYISEGGDVNAYLQGTVGDGTGTVGEVPQPVTQPDTPPVNQSESRTEGEISYDNGASYIDPSKSTVQGQLDGLLDESNPLMQQSKTRALQDMNSRGLQNSSMATTAGQSAMLSAALPIAQADANAYLAMDKLDADYNFKMDFWEKQNQFDRLALDKNLSMEERSMMTSAFTGMYNTVITNVGRVMTDDTMSAAGKRSSIDELWRNYQESVTTFADLNNYDYVW